MKSVKDIIPHNVGWLEVKLDDKEMDHLWRISKDEGLNHRKNLAGNISKSCLIEDKDGWFFNNVILKLCAKYADTYQDLVSKIPTYTRHPLELSSLWINYQKETEFNPLHHHEGTYSFVIFMKIPTSYKDQQKLPFVKGANEKHAVSNFWFTYTNVLGDVTGYYYEMSPKVEGTLLFFPSQLQHQVFPFYNCKEERITISGNVGIDTRRIIE